MYMYILFNPIGWYLPLRPWPRNSLDSTSCILVRVFITNTTKLLKNPFGENFSVFPKTFKLPITDNPWWRHQMETFSALLAFCAGNSPVPVNSPHKGQWRGALMFFLVYALTNDWVNKSWDWWSETPSRPLCRHSNAQGRSIIFFFQIWWRDIQCDKAVDFIKWPCLVDCCAFNNPQKYVRFQ